MNELGANVDALDRFGHTPFVVAVKEGYLDLMHVLVNELRADINPGDRDEKEEVG